VIASPVAQKIAPGIFDASRRPRLSALIFFAAFYAVDLIRLVDRALNEPLLYLNRTISHLYTRLNPINAPMTEHLRIVDLALTDSTQTKQACASLIDSLIGFDLTNEENPPDHSSNVTRAARHSSFS